MANIMNMILQPLSYASAYKQLRPSERAFVDAYVRECEEGANRENESIAAVLDRPPPFDIIERSNGLYERPIVQAAIVERIRQLAVETDLSAHMILKQWKAIGFSSMKDYMKVDEAGYLQFDFTEATPEQMLAVQSFEVDYKPRGGHTIKVRLYDKLKALDSMAEFIGMKESDNAYWKAMNAGPNSNKKATALSNSLTTEAVADMYHRRIN